MRRIVIRPPQVSVVAVVAHKEFVLVGDIDEPKVQPLQLRLDLVVAI